MRSSSTATACSCASKTAKRTMRTRKGLDWTPKFSGDCRRPPLAYRMRDRRRGRRARSQRRAGLSRRCRPPCRKAVRTTSSTSCSTCCLTRGEDLRSLSLSERKERLKALLGARAPHHRQIRFVDHLTEPGDAVLQVRLQSRSSKALSRSAPTPPTARAAPRRWMKSKCRAGHEVVIGGWSGSTTNLRSLIVGVYRGDHLVHTGRVGTGFNSRNTGDILKQAQRAQGGQEPVRRQGCATQRQGLDVGQAKARRRDRVRRLDRRRHGAAGRLQGPARGQAGERSQR